VPLPHTEGRVFGRYALYDEIASGGMATVHIGRLLGPVGFARTVAIKRLHAQFAKDPDFVSMFLDEGRLASRIRHPNVIGTLDVIALEGELFLVMEYVPGESLTRLWRATYESRQFIPVSIVSAILAGVLDGLHAAHEAKDDEGLPLGIVHRDVSPHNILVGTDGIARVLDFGVAKATGRLQSTHNGQLKGKISYMAPEQVHGSVDRRSDIYSASVVLWEALTGKRLFFAETQAKTLANVLYPRVDVPSRLVPALSRHIDEIVMRGLDPNPEGRFSTAREMAQALQQAIPPASSYAVGDWVESTAGKSLASRATKVARIARSSAESGPRALHVDDTAVPVSHFSLKSQGANDQGAVTADDRGTVTTNDRGAIGLPHSPQVLLAPPSKWRLGAIFVIIASLCAAVGFVSFHFVNQAPLPFGAMPMVETVGMPPHVSSAPAPVPASATVHPVVGASIPAASSEAAGAPPTKPVSELPAAPIGGKAGAPSSVPAAPGEAKDRSAARAGSASSTVHTASSSDRGTNAPRSPASTRKAAPAMDFDHVLDSRH
jgi:serine/threonine protein kinase